MKLKRLLRKCNYCLSYSISEICKHCGNQTHDAHPPRFSPEDKYIRYRIAARYNATQEIID
ncbi:MAG: RNA-protein complex protein Nop10 [Nitrososphaeraceae archaeon]